MIKQLRHQSKKLRESARGQDCSIRIPGVCNHNPETTVLSHINGGGMGTKTSDIHAAFCCSNCHDAVDYRVKTQYSRDEIELMHRQGVQRTVDYWLDNGLVKLA